MGECSRNENWCATFKNGIFVWKLPLGGTWKWLFMGLRTTKHLPIHHFGLKLAFLFKIYLKIALSIFAPFWENTQIRISKAMLPFSVSYRSELIFILRKYMFFMDSYPKKLHFFYGKNNKSGLKWAQWAFLCKIFDDFTNRLYSINVGKVIHMTFKPISHFFINFF